MGENLSGSGLALLGIPNTLSHYQAVSDDIIWRAICLNVVPIQTQLAPAVIRFSRKRGQSG